MTESNIGLIIGIVVGVISVMLIVLIAFVLFHRLGKFRCPINRPPPEGISSPDVDFATNTLSTTEGTWNDTVTSEDYPFDGSYGASHPLGNSHVMGLSLL
jgi:hypothetical protein